MAIVGQLKYTHASRAEFRGDATRREVSAKFCARARVCVFHPPTIAISGQESLILESDWLMTCPPAARIFPSGPRVRTAPIRGKT